MDTGGHPKSLGDADAESMRNSWGIATIHRVPPSVGVPELSGRVNAGTGPRAFVGGRHAWDHCAVPRVNRRTATRVRDGRVLKKNNWRPAPDDYRALEPGEIQLERRRPAEGSRHLVTVSQLRAFLPLLPQWDEAAIGLRAIVFDADTDCYGWYQSGVVALCNWDHDLWEVMAPEDLERNREMLDVLGVERVALDDSYFVRDLNDGFESMGIDQLEISPSSSWREVRWTEAQARAFLLLDVLPHELGHHHDLMTTRSRRRVARGEPYAESYARRTLDTVWDAYVRKFGI